MIFEAVQTLELQYHREKHVKRKEKTSVSCAQKRNERRYPEAAAKYAIV
ncbi:hypothetical protein FOXG_22668 [Fusarium oxysporum f. sp. lycopersici 4287]|uniref:Uncharacterized protein n=1 Tax=Fusarium oxysporum f. sp. lycopersici (strain 4287 / CBS 123668 / FGSC 9935 / NRRL 34936) TaxID=426428 RepID=A0A0J9WT52_FUSO4|nr:hypothetical protein FOXG_20999 [Fusarium oxysporum f. sp. lycopersici 4287]XP_018252122.1 hypothetical protein FOXG_21041 [Fusarium oxysporum f. sp. lycopersici 4287]XP_018253472.1 hypothetical protein FOXG_21317 [Fusarium oxysporum f. sp. lycopersici 4287]XP_018257936.1 hypothetical protein FOXG_22668 [Fusarium oxysporum f. sp. lycopersici 4287]KNB13961.1 hypothetical protein FOXG_20999 [Fusarium oxysporum f. sp. lycopersici 4287]KNB14077.1 hypothetical protein FOXG_21041 [Fusarium oxyspo